MAFHRKGWKKGLGNYRPGSLTLLSRRVMEQVILSVITWPFYRRAKGSGSASIGLGNRVTYLMHRGKAVDGVCLDLSKAFDFVSHRVWRNWLPVAWTDVLFVGLKTAWMARLEADGEGCHIQLVFSHKC